MKRWIPLLACLFFVAAGSSPALAQNNEQVRRSIAAAVAYLKSKYASGELPLSAAGIPGVGEGGFMEGPTALAGIALMEAGVSADDPVITAIASKIRIAAIRQHRTYQLALDIILLDKIGAEVDTHLIQSMGARLLFGQRHTGGWGYACPGADGAEQARLKGLVEAAGKVKAAPAMVGVDIESRPPLSEEVKDIIAQKRFVQLGSEVDTQIDDNSNTQFAVLGLWAARRHGLPVDSALKAVEQRFVASQDPRNGGWGYVVGAGYQGPTPAMTCAGLLAFAITAGNNGERVLRAGKKPGKGGQPSDKEPKDFKQVKIASPLKNPIVQRALAFIAPHIALPRNFNPNMGGTVAPSIPNAGEGSSGDISDLYFLWSLERVCMVFGIKDIAGRDWYAIGASFLIATQNARDGSWRGKYLPEIDTSFGLMFMCRSNVVRDLSQLFNPVLRTKPKNPNIAKGPSTTPGGNNTAPMPKPAADTDASSLAKSLVSAAGAKQTEILDKLTKEKGAIYTEALRLAIPQLTGDVHKRARDALSERVARFSADTIKAYLEHEDPEIRRAAAMAVYQRDERALIPNVITALGDSSEIVWRTARLVLKEMSGGRDFGPPAGATAEEKKSAIAAWTAWYKEQE